MRISRPFVTDDLEELWLPAEGRRLAPTDVSPEIITTHPAVHAGEFFRQLLRVSATGAVGITNVAPDTVAADNQIHYIWGAELFHNDAIARDAWFEIAQAGNVNRVTISRPVLALPTNTRFGLDRIVLVPPNRLIQGVVVALAAASQLTVVIYGLKVPVAMFAPPSS